MSEEIICLSSDDEEIICLSSDDEDTCIENSTKAGITSIRYTKITEYQLSTFKSRTRWHAEELCTYYEQEVKKAQDRVSEVEKCAEKVKLRSEESQTELANFLANPAYSHLEDFIKTTIHIQKARYKSVLQEVIYSKEWLEKQEKLLAMYKTNLKMLMQTKNS